jgi:hypothetical protein
MTSWLYGRLSVAYAQSVTQKKMLRRAPVVQHVWTVAWTGPDGAGPVGEWVSAADGPTDVLNEYGLRGWEVAAALR